tara:strand:- start:25 stop:555 length:531 start_codon:yes stop_codon:yes gene_type:complete
MILKNEEILFLLQCIRVITTIIILYILNIPIFLKILLIILTDLLDCDIPRLLFGSKKWLDCNESTYQKSDKITDTICYTLLLFYILENGGMSTNYNYLIILLFIYRLIGVYLFLIKNNRKYLFYFPNFFLEICLGLMVIHYYPILKKFKPFIILIIIIFKILQEYFLHVYKDTKDN